ncbi:MAG TPA: glycosyltransferase [Solirubrobacterales bacterium]|nr:glycosyltransferase [Solirubrobacterales bacterium]
MRIGFISESFEGGGAERQAALWIKACVDRGDEVTAITLRKDGHPLESAGIRHVHVPKQRSTDFIAVGRQLRRLDREVDAIVAFEPFLALCCAFANLRRPWMVVTGKVPYKLRENSRIPIAAFRVAFHRAALASAPSRGVVECHKRMGLRKRGEWRVIPNIADEAAFDQPSGERAGALFVGRLVPVKNPMLAAESAAVAGVPLTLLGEGALDAAIKRWAAARSPAPDVTLLPFERDPWPIYARHRALVVTSIVESFGNVLVESLAAGTPVVSVDCDFGPREVLAGASYSRLVEPSVEAVSAALRSVVEQPYGEAEERECLEIADRYRPSRIAPLIAAALDAMRASG